MSDRPLDPTTVSDLAAVLADDWRRDDPRTLGEIVGGLVYQRNRYANGLRAIVGPGQGDPFAEAYRAAGGGYEGLQAIAEAALNPPASFPPLPPEVEAVIAPYREGLPPL